MVLEAVGGKELLRDTRPSYLLSAHVDEVLHSSPCSRVYCSSYKEALELCPSLVEEEKDTRWIPPAIGTIKINFDGANFQDPKSTSIGCIGRDSSGSCCAWRQQRLNFSTTPEVAEALAVLEALKLGIISFSFVHREDNRPAHGLARTALGLLEGNTITPPRVFDFVRSDIA
ncbi:hypothetical protein BUALT_Bualt16G0064300 [Buddleja alternifolia]|uniref:RNase H type-1 domain-containing protein n=1 Tax=Buddleja alternifolia TaxID=168488 RepID=A0AAV6W9J3_9LAMI|nr:hypothetical protein BUALT_Bualt16G0064300 [Buddleja alternifolia]